MPDDIHVSILIVISYYTTARRYHWGKLGEGYSLHSFLLLHKKIYSYLNTKSLFISTLETQVIHKTIRRGEVWEMIGLVKTERY